MLATTNFLDKARQGRRAALAALTVARLGDEDDNVVSIFDEAFDAKFNDFEQSASNVIPFPAAATPRPALLAA
ncbi:MAG TPA: hypothetical protein DIU07_11255 [Rhodobacteraceae bacterium]|nr:hypothetical protein [Paracoccaceae bacterium]